MKPMVFVDTAAWLVFIGKSDPMHKKALSLLNEVLDKKTQLILTDYIILEIANSLCKTGSRESAVKLISHIRKADYITVVEVDSFLLEESWCLYKERNDKEWSLTDCVSFMVMKKKKITTVLTSDRHFEQAGFTALLKV